MLMQQVGGAEGRQGRLCWCVGLIARGESALHRPGFRGEWALQYGLTTGSSAALHWLDYMKRQRCIELTPG